MNTTLSFSIDVIAISLLVFGIYFPRHHRRDVPVALLVVNLGVLAAVTALRSIDTPETIGLGLFGILSIIRLRSSEVDQQEVAYYFAALAIGVLAGLKVAPAPLAPALTVAVLLALWIGDHPGLFGGHRRHVMTLDRAFTNEAELRDHLATLLGAKIHRVLVNKVDLVHDTTVVEVRYQLDEKNRSGRSGRHASKHDGPAEMVGVGAHR